MVRRRQRQQAVDGEAGERQQRNEPQPARRRIRQRMGRGRRRFLNRHQPLRMLMFWRFTVCRCRKSAMMIARPTAASAAATVITKKTKTCPATPYTCANATKLRFTALSISSTHMKMMIAFRRVSTPTTPITNSTAEKKSDSASIGFLLASACQGDGTHDGGEQQDAGEFEGEQILVEERPGHGLERALGGDLRRRVVGGQSENVGRFR